MRLISLMKESINWRKLIWTCRVMYLAKRWIRKLKLIKNKKTMKFRLRTKTLKKRTNNLCQQMIKSLLRQKTPWKMISMDSLKKSKIQS